MDRILRMTHSRALAKSSPRYLRFLLLFLILFESSLLVWRFWFALDFETSFLNFVHQGEWSRRLEVDTRQLNKHWYCLVTPYVHPNGQGPSYFVGSSVLFLRCLTFLGFAQDIIVSTAIQGKKQDDATWTTIVNSSVPVFVICAGVRVHYNSLFVRLSRLTVQTLDFAHF